MNPVDIKTKLSQITKLWTPYILAKCNDHFVKAARLEGEFIWHAHSGEDELFLVISGMLFIDFRDHSVSLQPGQFLVVPKGVEHRPRTGPDGAEVLLFEPAATKHTGDLQTERTVHDQEWL